MAESFGVNVKRDWQLESAYLELLSKDQLPELAAEWKATSDKAWSACTRNKCTELIEGLLNLGVVKKLPCPKALVDAKRPGNFCF